MAMESKNPTGWICLVLDRGLRAQYAILIEDVGESRININATGNIGTASGNFVYGTGATTFDIRLQDILGTTAATNTYTGNNHRALYARHAEQMHHTTNRAIQPAPTAPLTSLTPPIFALARIPSPNV